MLQRLHALHVLGRLGVPAEARVLGATQCLQLVSLSTSPWVATQELPAAGQPQQSLQGPDTDEASPASVREGNQRPFAHRGRREVDRRDYTEDDSTMRRRVSQVSRVARVKLKFPVRIGGGGRFLLRSDIQDLLSGLGVLEADIRPQYSQELQPMAYWVDCPTPAARHAALKFDGSLLGAARIRVEAVGHPEMREAIFEPLAMGSRGRYCLMSGIPENGNLEEIVRFFEGYDLMGTSVTMVKEERKQWRGLVTRHTPAEEQVMHRALLRFETAQEAQRAARERSGAFLLNFQVNIRVLP